MPINKTINATKKVCTYISCLLIKLSDDNSCFQLKYFGKIMIKVIGVRFRRAGKVYYYGYSSWKGSMLYLDDLVVKEAYRKHGIGKKLLD